ncbi:MAG: hypothetical protein HRU26_17440 [Psychroserpens sp.]|nr:hypothetical protein [Psychroserpens sp.]
MIKAQYIQAIFVCLFIGLLSIPSLTLFLNSEAKAFPEIDYNNLSSSIDKVEDYYNDLFGFKSELVDGYTTLKNDLIGNDPLPHKVMQGKDGWYFLGNHHNNLFDDSFGLHAFTDDELTAIKDYLSPIVDGFRSRGINFHIIVPPNKHRVYPENLPYQFHQGQNRLEQLNNYLKATLDFEIIDLRPSLISQKSEDLLYYKTNTHWNDLGAYYGYKASMNIIAPDLPIIPLSEFTKSLVPIKRGDITEMINITSDEMVLSLKKTKPSQVKTIKDDPDFLRYRNYSKEKILVMYRDSFSNAWIPFFNESFNETIYKKGYYVNFGFIDHKKPDVVIFEIIERNLGQILLHKKRSSN